MSGLLRALLVLPALALFCGALPLWLAAGELPALDVHGVPWRLHTGRLLERFPPGQGFRCAAPGLRRVDVALVRVRRDARGGVRLRLRADHAGGEVLREVELPLDELPDPQGWARFEFEPVEDSAGRSFFFELLPGGDVKPADVAAFVRFHGQVGHDGPWGYQRYEGPVIEGRLRLSRPPEVEQARDDPMNPDDVPHPWLRAVSFAALGVAPRLGPARLELWREGDEEGPPLRVVTLSEEDEVQNGHLVFSFAPIEHSRWLRYTYRLTLPPHSILLGDRWGPAMKTWHGLEGGDARLLGATAGGAARHDRDLVFRAWARPDPRGALERAAERAGWRLRAAVGLWALGALALLALALRPPRKSPPAGFHAA